MCTVAAADLQKALDPKIWPLRVRVREYIYYPRKKQQNGQANSNSEQHSLAVPQPSGPQPSQPPTVQITPPSQQQSVCHDIPLSNRYNALSADDCSDDIR